MPKPKKPAAVTLADGALIDIPEQELEDPESVAIEEAMRTFGDSGAGVKVYKEGPGGYRDIIFLFGCLPSEWLDTGLERLQANYGKGRYRVHMKGTNGLLMIKKAINIEGLPQSERQPVQPVAQPAHDSMTTPFALALAEISKGQAAIAAMLERMATQAPPNPMHTLEGLKQLADILKPAPVAAPAPAGMDFKTTLDAAAQLVAISQGFKGGSGRSDSDPESHALTRGIDLVAKMVEKHVETRGAAPAAASAPALPAPSDKPIEGENVMTTQQQRGLAMLRLQLEEANDAAASDMPAEAFVDEMYDMIPDDVIQMIGTDPAWFEICVKNVPGCAKFRPWYESARNRIVALALEDGLLTAPPESGSVPESPKADAKDDADNGDTRTPGAGTTGNA